MEKQLTVLLADDNKMFRQSVQVLLATFGAVRICWEACNGEEAIALAAEHSPDIVLLDINMSPVNGFEATRKILRQNPAIKIIGFSMHTGASYCQNLMRLGARGYLSKDSSPAEIRMAITEVASGGKYISKNIQGNL